MIGLDVMVASVAAPSGSASAEAAQLAADAEALRAARRELLVRSAVFPAIIGAAVGVASESALSGAAAAAVVYYFWASYRLRDPRAILETRAARRSPRLVRARRMMVEADLAYIAPAEGDVMVGRLGRVAVGAGAGGGGGGARPSVALVRRDAVPAAADAAPSSSPSQASGGDRFDKLEVD